ncbi:MAG: DsbC family protein [Betaproteobacteria bacterium]|nr:DsbC family protein [Betaproteobacteria bacterium]
MPAPLKALCVVPFGMEEGSEADIRRKVQAMFPEAPVESVAKTPFSGLYEVVLGGRILYADEKVNFVFIGSLLDTRGPVEKDLTRERGAQLASQTLRKSTDQAIKRVRGNGKRVLYTFEDPNCPYCKELQKELAKVNDITIYTFLWPILGPDSVDKSKAVWCARDRGKAWDDMMSRGVEPQNDGKCETPIDRNMQLARRFGIRGTPAIFLTDGRQAGAGFMPAAEIEQALNLVSPR